MPFNGGPVYTPFIPHKTQGPVLQSVVNRQGTMVRDHATTLRPRSLGVGLFGGCLGGGGVCGSFEEVWGVWGVWGGLGGLGSLLFCFGGLGGGGGGFGGLWGGFKGLVVWGSGVVFRVEPEPQTPDPPSKRLL